MNDANAVFSNLLTMFKALGNESRLRMVVILAQGECTVRELAQRLALKEPTVSEHLALLKDADLVTMRAEGNYRIYGFNPQALSVVQELYHPEQFAALVQDSVEEQKVLRNYLDAEGRLVVFPGNRKKLLVILRWLANKFEFGRRYSEAEVNAIIRRHHEDYATLRRELIGQHLMMREQGVYWRIES